MCKADPTLSFCYPSSSSGGSDSGGGGGPAAPGPVMKMYFFNEMPFYLLFKSWTPRSTGDLVTAWFAIFLLGVFYEFLQMMYGKKEAEFWARRAQRSAMVAAAAAATQRGMDEESGGPLAEGVAGGDDGDQDSSRARAAAAIYASGGGGYSCCSTAPPQVALATDKGAGSCCGGGGGSGPAGLGLDSRPDSSAGYDRSRGVYGKGKGSRGVVGAVGAYMQPDLVAMDVIRGVARFVLAGIAYLLMLAAMCFNVPIFFAVICGVAVGSMLFGRWRWTQGVNEGYSHCGCGSS